MNEPLDEYLLTKLAREMAMNIRSPKDIFADYGIDETGYYELAEKNEFFKRVKEQFTIEWNATTSTESRVRISSLAQLEQLFPILTKRAMRKEEGLAPATEVGKLLAKTAGVGGETKGEKGSMERFQITIDLGGDIERYDKPIAIDAGESRKIEW